jgi:hypothetical protein
VTAGPELLNDQQHHRIALRHADALTIARPDGLLRIQQQEQQRALVRLSPVEDLGVEILGKLDPLIDQSLGILPQLSDERVGGSARR